MKIQTRHKSSATVCGLIFGLVTMAIHPTGSCAEEPYSGPVFVTLKQDNGVVSFPGASLWKGGPTMLYAAITPDGKVLMVTSPTTDQVYAFDGETGEKIAVVATGKAPKGVKITPDGKEAWISNEAGNTISIVNLSTYKISDTIETERMPHNVRFSENGKIAYVTLQGGAGLGVIDTATRKVTRVIPIPGISGPHNLDLSSDGKRAFVRDVVNSVAVLDLETGNVKKVISTGMGHAGIDVLPNGRYVVTGAIGDSFVTVIDPETLDVIKNIPVGTGPHGVRASADSRWVYVTVTADNKVVVIDTETLEVAKEYPVGRFPFWVAVRGNS